MRPRAHPAEVPTTASASRRSAPPSARPGEHADIPRRRAARRRRPGRPRCASGHHAATPWPTTSGWTIRGIPRHSGGPRLRPGTAVAQQRKRRPVAVAAGGERAPRPGEPVLTPGEPGLVGAHVLDGTAAGRRAGARGAARARAARASAHGAQHQRPDDRVEARVGERERLGARVDDARRAAAAGDARRSRARIAASGSVRMSASTPGRVGGEVGAGAGADLQHAAAGGAEQVAPQRGHPAALAEREEGVVEPGGARAPRGADGSSEPWQQVCGFARRARLRPIRPSARMAGSGHQACVVARPGDPVLRRRRRAHRGRGVPARAAARAAGLVGLQPRGELGQRALPRVRRRPRARAHGDPLRPGRHRASRTASARRSA